PDCYVCVNPTAEHRTGQARRQPRDTRTHRSGQATGVAPQPHGRHSFSYAATLRAPPGVDARDVPLASIWGVRRVDVRCALGAFAAVGDRTPKEAPHPAGKK